MQGLPDEALRLAEQSPSAGRSVRTMAWGGTFSACEELLPCQSHLCWRPRLICKESDEQDFAARVSASAVSAKFSRLLAGTFLPASGSPGQAAPTCLQAVADPSICLLSAACGL